MGVADGVLERKSLLLARRDSTGRRAILDADDATPVGSCQRRRRAGWWSSFTRPVVEVHEQQDDSLLFSVRRCWSLFSWYEVWDADDRAIGWHGGPLLLSRTGRRMAVREDETGAGTSSYLAQNGKALARLNWQGDDVRLSFEDEIADEPFVKMLLLAAALRW
jgi:hypothetical protein